MAPIVGVRPRVRLPGRLRPLARVADHNGWNSRFPEDGRCLGRQAAWDGNPVNFLGDARYADVLNRDFNYVTAEYQMKWDPIETVPGVNNFSGGDAIAWSAASHGMQLKGHALIWHGATPGWVTALSPADLRLAFENHIRTTADHFRGRVLAWDVVNEAVADGGAGLRDTVFGQKLGDDYIADAFRLARAADPGALLFYNDYGGEGLGAKYRPDLRARQEPARTGCSD